MSMTMSSPRVITNKMTSLDPPNAARVALHKAGWDYWNTRYLRATDATDKAACATQMNGLMPLFRASKGALPFPTLECRFTAGKDDEVFSTVNFYDVDTPPQPPPLDDAQE